jgi:hypothetical protein
MDRGPGVVVRELGPLGQSLITELLDRVLGQLADATLRERLVRLLLDAALDGADSQAVRFGRGGRTIAVDHPLLREAVRVHTPAIVGINQTTREAIRDRLLAIAMRGGGFREQQQAVREVFAEASLARARTIARTESAIAWNTGGHAQALDLGGRSHDWLTARDQRVRKSHVEADGQCRPIGVAFDVGGAKLLHPGDPSAPVRETANCRCTALYSARQCGGDLPKTYAERTRIWKGIIVSLAKRERLALGVVRTVFRAQRLAVLAELERMAPRGR